MPTAKNVFLIGMPGSGKSTVGRLLAKELDRPFVDSDEEIVRRNGVDIPTIFEIEGEIGFREREATVLRELADRDEIVLATGGGAIVSEANRQLLRRRGLVIYLRASIDVLTARTQKKAATRGHPVRPLLEGVDHRSKLETLLQAREPLYNATAHLTVDSTTTHRTRLLQKLLSAIRLAEQPA
jgi:shikimate kinase